MGRLLPSRSLRPKKTYSRVAGAPVVPPVLRRPRPPERHAEQRESPARGEFYRGTVPAAPTAATGRRTCTQRPLRPRARTRARRQPGRTSGYPADCGSGCPTQCRALHPGAHGLSLRAPMWSRDRPRFPGTLRRGSRDREPPARRRHRFPPSPCRIRSDVYTGRGPRTRAADGARSAANKQSQEDGRLSVGIEVSHPPRAAAAPTPQNAADGRRALIRGGRQEGRTFRSRSVPVVAVRAAMTRIAGKGAAHLLTSLQAIGLITFRVRLRATTDERPRRRRRCRCRTGPHSRSFWCSAP